VTELQLQRIHWSRVFFCKKVAVAQLATNCNTRFITMFTKDYPWILL